MLSTLLFKKASSRPPLEASLTNSSVSDLPVNPVDRMDWIEAGSDFRRLEGGGISDFVFW